MGNLFSFTDTNNTNTLNKDDIIFPTKKTEVIVSNTKLKTIEIKYKITIDLEIKFKNSFNKNLDKNYIELFEKYHGIIFGFSFNHMINEKIPTNIIFLHFGHNFNQPINNMIYYNSDIDSNTDSKMKEIIFGSHFNQSVDNLPPNIKKITFGDNFNCEVKNLPSSIEFIKFGYMFNKSVEYLPCGLIYIEFGNNFNHKICDLPTTIEEIKLGSNFEQEITLIPHKLKKIILFSNYYNLNKNHLEKNIFASKLIDVVIQ